MKIPSIFRLFMDDANSSNNKQTISYSKNKKIQKNKVIDDSTSHRIHIKGLSSEKAMDILKKDGENKLISQKKVSAAKIFAGQFKDFLVLILLVGMLISVFMGEILEAISISIILFLSAVMGFIQEYKTEKTLEALENMVAPSAKVFRDGKLSKIPANLIVRGDEIVVEAGDSVPADAVLLESTKIEVDESILTGESTSVVKEASDLNGSMNEINKNNVLYMGTLIFKGHGRARVIRTGMNTQIGKIAGMIDNVDSEQTPLQQRLAQIGKFIIVGCLIVSAIVIFAGILRGEDPFNMIITGLSVAVASVPEGLPAIVTIALALAVKRMVKRKALVRKLHAVETLGCANVICTDKTGTITQNKMTVKRIVTADGDFKVEGDETKNNGCFVFGGEKINVSDYPILELLIETSVVCNGSHIVIKDRNNGKSDWKGIGEPTEIALLMMAKKGNITKDSLKTKYNIYDAVPFDSSRKYMSVFAENIVGKKYVFVKGAYDVVLDKCNGYKSRNGIESFSKAKTFFDKKNEELAKSGMRVLAFAYKEISGSDNDNNLIFLGLTAMHDPPRKEAKSAVMTCRYAGIKTIMITGDHKLTAISIAKQVGIYRKGDMCVEGKELNNMSDSALKEIIKKTTVFARVSPSHKLRIVKALKKQGNIVAMTGDGVNDAPAIKEANIGVSMGESGSDVAKQSADLILLDDNFATLVAAVEEGRIIYENIRKFMRYLLSCNMGEVLTTLFAMLIGMPIPLLPMQILLINLVTDGLPAIALGLEPGDKNTMKKAPRNVNESIFSGGLVFTIFIRGVLIAFTTLTVFTIMLRMTNSLAISRTAIFLTLVGLQLIHVFECKSESKSIFKINHLQNKKLILATIVSLIIAISAIWIEPVNKIIKNCPLDMEQTVVVLGFILFIPIVNAIVMNCRTKVKNMDDMKVSFPIEYKY